MNSVVSTLRGSDDEELGKETLNTLLYNGHPYGAPVNGTEEGLASIALDDVRAFHASHYTKANVIVGIAGGYPDDFGERVQREIVAQLPDGGSTATILPAVSSLDGREMRISNSWAKRGADFQFTACQFIWKLTATSAEFIVYSIGAVVIFALFF